GTEHDTAAVVVITRVVFDEVVGDREIRLAADEDAAAAIGVVVANGIVVCGDGGVGRVNPAAVFEIRAAACLKRRRPIVLNDIVGNRHVGVQQVIGDDVNAV